MAILLLLPQYVTWRIQLSEREFELLANITALGILILILYLIEQHGAHTIFRILQLSPLTIFPLWLAQHFNFRAQMRLGTFFLSLRRTDTYTRSIYNPLINIDFPCFLLCLLAATVSSTHSWVFGILCLLLLLPTLKNIVPAGKIHRRHFWLAAGLAAVLGLIMQYSFRYYQPSQYQWVDEMIQRFFSGGYDFLRQNSTIGQLGRKKNSERILLWVRSNVPDNNLSAPILLSVNSYDHYQHATWSNSNEQLIDIEKRTNKDLWVLPDSAEEIPARIQIGMHLIKSENMLPLPAQTANIYAKNALTMRMTPHKHVYLENNPGWFEYSPAIRADRYNQAVPQATDLMIYPGDQEILQPLLDTLHLAEKKPAEIIAAVTQYFAKNYRYSLKYIGWRHSSNKLQHFLYQDKQGHCEYFATITALLLRSAGIPSRYVTGYLLHEQHPLEEDTWIVRRRHAHSWVNYYLDGQWHILDTTPAIWVEEEKGRFSVINLVYDTLMWLRYLYSKEKDYADISQNQYRQYLLGILFLLLLLAVWRLRRMRSTHIETATGTLSQQGKDSPLYPLLAKLSRHAEKECAPGQTLKNWLHSILPAAQRASWSTLLTLHYRYRFGRKHDCEKSRKELQQYCDTFNKNNDKPL